MCFGIRNINPLPTPLILIFQHPKRPCIKYRLLTKKPMDFFLNPPAHRGPALVRMTAVPPSAGLCTKMGISQKWIGESLRNLKHNPGTLSTSQNIKNIDDQSHMNFGFGPTLTFNPTSAAARRRRPPAARPICQIRQNLQNLFRNPKYRNATPSAPIFGPPNRCCIQNSTIDKKAYRFFLDPPAHRWTPPGPSVPPFRPGPVSGPKWGFL